MQILQIDKTLLKQILPLIAEYQKFYGAVPPLEKNQAFFESFLQMPDRAIQFGAFDEKGSALGFTTLYFLLSSLSAQNCCVLNDLYTIPAARGKGVGRALLHHAREHAKIRGYSSIEWLTEKRNKTAQRLYDQQGAEKSEWLYYSWRT